MKSTYNQLFKGYLIRFKKTSISYFAAYNKIHEKRKEEEKMANLKSYEEFEKEFNETEQNLTKFEQSRIDRIVKILNQRVSEVSKYKKSAVRKELALMDLHMEEIQIIENMSQDGFIEGKPTNEVYQSYIRACSQGGLTPMNQITFSQFIIKYFEYTIKDKKIKGKKYRIFVNDFVDWWKK